MLDTKKKKDKQVRFYERNPGYIRIKYLERKEQYRLGIKTKKQESNESSKKRYKKHIDSISDYYIIRRLVFSGFKKEDITPELIELKRQLIKLNRIINEKLQRRNSIAN